MTDTFPEASHADNEADYPLPPDGDIQDAPADAEPDPEAEPVTVPAPSHPVDVPGLAVPRARRELKATLEAAKVALASLKRLQVGEPVQLDAVAVDALICGAYDRQYPVDDTAQVDRLRGLALSGKLNRHVPLALDELEDVLATLEAALSALKAISFLGEPIPAEWSNLHPVLLARKLNVLGHTLLRGRIAGVSL